MRQYQPGWSSSDLRSINHGKGRASAALAESITSKTRCISAEASKGTFLILLPQRSWRVPGYFHRGATTGASHPYRPLNVPHREGQLWVMSTNRWWAYGTAASPSTAEGPFYGSQRGLVPSSVRASNSIIREPTGAGPEHDWSSRGGGWGMRFLTIYRGEVTVCRARLAPEMISTPGHRDLRRRQRRTLPVWLHSGEPK
jgi:hypothetical protein